MYYLNSNLQIIKLFVPQGTRYDSLKWVFVMEVLYQVTEITVNKGYWTSVLVSPSIGISEFLFDGVSLSAVVLCASVDIGICDAILNGIAFVFSHTFTRYR